VTIAVTENLENVRQILLELVRNNSAYLDKPTPRVVITQLNDYNVTMELQVWLENERQHLEEKFKLREQVFNALNAAAVEMPFETIQLQPLNVKIMHANGDRI
jgi:small conductance mechanosensitive channel